MLHCYSLYIPIQFMINARLESRLIPTITKLAPCDCVILGVPMLFPFPFV